MIATAGQRFDPKEGPIYFIAASPKLASIGSKHHPFVLVPTDQLLGKTAQRNVETLVNNGICFLLDSGVHSFVMAIRKEKKLTALQALSLTPADIPSYPKLRDTYIQLAQRIGDKTWGYIELDFGGAEQKRIIRRELEQRWGLRPIPVYHPLVDPPEYFDELASGYDRVAIGNLAHQSTYVRERITATVWTRAQAYPGLWLHGLGQAPDQQANAFAFQSVDASSWLVQVQYPIGFTERAMGQPVYRLDHEYRPERNTTDPEKHSSKGAELGAYICAMIQRNWRTATARERELAPPGPLMGAVA